MRFLVRSMYGSFSCKCDIGEHAGKEKEMKLKLSLFDKEEAVLSEERKVQAVPGETDVSFSMTIDQVTHGLPNIPIFMMYHGLEEMEHLSNLWCEMWVSHNSV